jgi:prevent-host-death family protein
MSALSISVPLAEAKSKLSELVDRVSRGEEFVITRHDTEIARLVPAQRPSRHDVSDAIAQMRAARQRRSASTAEIQAWKNEGRR